MLLSFSEMLATDPPLAATSDNIGPRFDSGLAIFNTMT